MPVYIKKYTGSNYFSSRTIVDTLTLTTLPKEAFPIFRFQTEDMAGVGTYRGGDFDMNISLVNQTLSLTGLSIKDFFLGTQRDYYYLVIIVIGSMSFCGIAQQSQISGDFTYNKGKKEIRITCKDILIEWAKRCETVPNSTIIYGTTNFDPFETYIQKHFAGITSDVVLLGFPENSYLSKMQSVYPTVGNCFADGEMKTFITGQTDISRWETFKELAKGLGFNFEMYLNPGSEVLNEPEFIFRIFFIDDIVNETPISVTVLEHQEFTTMPRLEWVYLKYRYFRLSNISYTDGIIFNNLSQYSSDTDHGDSATIYPSLLTRLQDKILDYVNGSGVTEKTIIRDVDFNELELKLYQYAFGNSEETKKLHPLNDPSLQGYGLSYARIMNCSRGSDNLDFAPCQEYAIKNYKRFVKGNFKGKTLLLKFNETSEIKNWKPIVLNDGNGDEKYYISAINKIDTQKKHIEVDAILLTN